MGFIQKIRGKSQKEKSVYAIIVSLIIVVIIGIFWIMSISGRFSESRENTPRGTGPFQVIGEMFSSGFTQFREERPRMSDELEDGEGLFILDDDDFDDDLPSAADILQSIRQATERPESEDDDQSTEGEIEGEAEVTIEAESQGDDEMQEIVIDGIEIVEVQE